MGSGRQRLMSTTRRVRRLLALQARKQRSLEADLRLARALAASDAPPTAWQLQVSAESSRYFLTEGAALPQGAWAQPGCAGQPQESAAALGLEPAVPRFLRWPGPGAVPLHHLMSAEVEAVLVGVWRAKAAAGAARGGQCGPLHSFLHEHLLQVRSGDTAAAAAAGYSIYHAATRLGAASGRGNNSSSSGGASERSAAAGVYIKVLTGQLPEGVFWEQQRLLQGLHRVLACGAAACTPPQELCQQQAAVGESGDVGGCDDNGASSSSSSTHPVPADFVATEEQLAAAFKLLLPSLPADRFARLRLRVAAAAAPGAWDLPTLAAAVASRLVVGPTAGMTAAEAGGGSGGRCVGAAAAGGGAAESGGAAWAAAGELLDELLIQHLEEVEQHMGGVLDRGRAVLAAWPGSSSGSGSGVGVVAGIGAADGIDVEQLCDKLQRALFPDKPRLDGRFAASSRRASSGSGRGSGSGGRGGYAAGVNAANADGSLLSVAAAARARQAARAAEPTGNAMLPPWLQAAVCTCVQRLRQQITAGVADAAGSGGAAALGPTAVEELLASVRAGLLLLPPSCAIDVPSAMQWAAVSFGCAGKGSRDGGGPVASAQPAGQVADASEKEAGAGASCLAGAQQAADEAALQEH